MIKNTKKKIAAVKAQPENATAPVKAPPAQTALPAESAVESPVKPQPPTSTADAPRSAGPVRVELVQPGAKHVCVAGSFNGWQPEQAPMVAAGNGRWVGNLAIQPGRYEYLFVVDGQWLPDPNARETVANPFGGRNSVLMVSA